MQTKIHISKTRINRKLERKTNPELVETVLAAKKLKTWRDIASKIAKPRRMLVDINLDELDRESKEGDTILVPGKVLGGGNVSKKLRVVALAFSEQAREKLKEKKCEAVLIMEEIKVNPKAQGLKVLG